MKKLNSIERKRQTKYVVGNPMLQREEQNYNNVHNLQQVLLFHNIVKLLINFSLTAISRLKYYSNHTSTNSDI